MYKICDNIILTEMGDEIVVSRRNDDAGNILIVFNDVGKIIVRHLATNHTFKTIVDDLHQKTGADIDRIEKDLHTFINRLENARIIEASE